MKILSQKQKDLINCLKYLKIEDDAIVVILLNVKKDYQISQLAEFLLLNNNASQSQIIKKAIEIGNS